MSTSSFIITVLINLPISLARTSFLQRKAFLTMTGNNLTK